jgi:hypothetical protein
LTFCGSSGGGIAPGTEILDDDRARLSSGRRDRSLETRKIKTAANQSIRVGAPANVLHHYQALKELA